MNEKIVAENAMILVGADIRTACHMIAAKADDEIRGGCTLILLFKAGSHSSSGFQTAKFMHSGRRGC